MEARQCCGGTREDARGRIAIALINPRLAWKDVMRLTAEWSAASAWDEDLAVAMLEDIERVPRRSLEHRLTAALGLLHEGWPLQGDVKGDIAHFQQAVSVTDCLCAL